MLDKKNIIEYYKKICFQEHIMPLPIKFKHVGKKGASITGNKNTMKPLYISLDLSKLNDPESALLHEMAHQICLIKYKSGAHSKKFKDTFNYLSDKYIYSELSSILYKK